MGATINLHPFRERKPLQAGQVFAHMQVVEGGGEFPVADGVGGQEQRLHRTHQHLAGAQLTQQCLADRIRARLADTVALPPFGRPLQVGDLGSEREAEQQRQQAPDPGIQPAHGLPHRLHPAACLPYWLHAPLRVNGFDHRCGPCPA